jgi:flagellar biosynthesis GTPase FlhF
MRLKSYFANTMEEAMLAAKNELGDEAMLVDSKRLAGGSGDRVRFEVIFAAPAVIPPPVVKKPRAGGNAGGNAKDGWMECRGEWMALLQALREEPGESRLAAMSPAQEQMDAVFGHLLQSEVPPAAADEMAKSCRPLLEALVLESGDRRAELERVLVPLFAAEMPHALETDDNAPRAIALVGPNGVGKTSMTAKLAFRFGIEEGRPVRVVSMDNLRIGAAEQLAQLCSLMGIPFQSTETGGSAVLGLTGRAREVVLVDTPGFAADDEDLMEEMATQLRRAGGVQCQLVLPATLRYRAMERAVERHARFAPSRLLFTRIDETEVFGPAWALSRNRQLPVEWVSTGPRIPEDMAAAEATRFASEMLSGLATIRQRERGARVPETTWAAKAGGTGR